MGTGDVLVFGLALLTLFGVWVRGARWTFERIYVPSLLLIPTQPILYFSGVPDLNPHRACAAALLFACLVTGDLYRLLPRRWKLIDLLALAPVLSFSISYAVAQDSGGFDLKAFRHEIPQLFLDWGCPYLFMRALVTDRAALRRMLGPVLVSTLILAALAVIECRMATRFAVHLWNSIGLGLPVPPHYGDWRLGLLRAFTHFLGPITLGTVFVSLAPLMIAYGQLEPKSRRWAQIATAAAVVGVGCCLSRGPALVLALMVVLVPVAVYRMRAVALIAGLVLLFAIPTIWVVAGEAISYTIARVEQTGNTAGESGYYRIALLIIYGKQVATVGFWGAPELIGAGKYGGANSIDNAYLYLFLIGGWVGGGLMILINLTLLRRAWRAIHNLNGAPRWFGYALTASFAGVVMCMGNVWFAPDYAGWYWLSAGLMANLPQHLAGLDTVSRPAMRPPAQSHRFGFVQHQHARETG